MWEGSLARYDHDHRFNGFFVDAFPNQKYSRSSKITALECSGHFAPHCPGGPGNIQVTYWGFELDLNRLDYELNINRLDYIGLDFIRFD